MPKKADGTPPSKPSFTRLKPETLARLNEKAAHYRVTISDLLRWAAEDMVSGKYLPDNLSPPKEKSA